MNVGLTVDAVGTLKEHETLIEALNDLNVKSTFFIRGRTHPKIVNLIYDNGHEIGNHTYTHPVSLLNLTTEDKELEIEKTDRFLKDTLKIELKNVEIKGLRAPYYNFDPEIPKIIERINYLWDSTKAYFPILGSHFKPEKYGKIVELPSLFPDDITMLSRMNLLESQVLKIWKKTYDLSEDTFIWGIHPYTSAINEKRVKMLKKFIEYIIDKNGNFLCMSDIAKIY